MEDGVSLSIFSLELFPLHSRPLGLCCHHHRSAPTRAASLPTPTAWSRARARTITRTAPTASVRPTRRPWSRRRRRRRRRQRVAVHPHQLLRLPLPLPRVRRPQPARRWRPRRPRLLVDRRRRQRRRISSITGTRTRRTVRAPRMCDEPEQASTRKNSRKIRVSFFLPRVLFSHKVSAHRLMFAYTNAYVQHLTKFSCIFYSTHSPRKK